eukprot:gene10526-11462_t
MEDFDEQDYERQQLEYFQTTLPQFDFSPTFSEAIYESLSLHHLKKLSINGSQANTRFSDTDVINLIEALNVGHAHLEEIALTHHRITDVGFEEILRLLKPTLYAESSSQIHNQAFLLSINLEGNDIQGNSIENSPLNSKYDCSLQSLNLSSNPISKKGQIGLSNMIMNNQILKQLILNNCNFELNGLILFTSNLLHNDSLQTLSFNRPLLTNIKEELIIDHIHRVLLSNQHLTDLSLKYYNIYDFGAKLLSESLLRNHYMISLNLECNHINVAGAEAIASYLLDKPKNCLRFLGLSYNRVSNDGAIALAEAIKNNTNLRSLTLKSNNIGPIGLEAIAQALATSVNLESLTIFGNNFDNQNGRDYFELIRHRLPYTNMYLDIKVYVVDGQYKIAEN